MNDPLTNVGTAQIEIFNHYIDGKDYEPVQKRYLDKVNPAMEEVDAMIAYGCRGDVDHAVKSARRAFDDDWSKRTGSERQRFMLKIADLMEKSISILEQGDRDDIGKPITQCRQDLKDAVDCWRYYAGLADKISGTTTPINQDSFSYTIREPVGVIGMITPWMMPSLHFSRYVAAALACGNTVVVKPSEHAARAALRIAALCTVAALPDGVVNVVCGDGESTGVALAGHPDVGHLCFIGNSEIGKLVAGAVSSRLATVTCELSAKNAAIITETANLDLAAESCVAMLCKNQGQSNLAASRLLVAEKVKNEFRKKLVDLVKKIKLGTPANEEAMMSCVASVEQRERMEGFVRMAEEEGATLLCGGKRPDAPDLQGGYYFEPTVFDGVTAEMTIACEEIFGPIMAIMPYRSMDELVNIANSTRYGRAVWVFGNDLREIQHIVHRIDVADVIVNQSGSHTVEHPVSGNRESGLGRALGTETITQLTRTRNVTIAL